MADFTMSAVLDFDGKRFTAGMRRAGKQITVMERQINSASRNINNFSNLVIGAGAILALGRLGKAAIDAGEDILNLERSLGLMTRSLQAADRPAQSVAQQIEFLRDLANESGRSFTQVSDAFAKLSPAAATAGLEVDEVQRTFRGLLDALAASGADTQKANRAFTAVTQVFGKGVLQMEELRQQLGEAIPNIIPLLVDGLNQLNAATGKFGETTRFTTANLIEFVQARRISAGDFARAITLATEQLAGVSAQFGQQLSGQISRFQNIFQVEVGQIFQKGGISNALAVLLSEFNTTFEKILRVVNENSDEIGNSIIRAFSGAMLFAGEAIIGLAPIINIIGSGLSVLASAVDTLLKVIPPEAIAVGIIGFLLFGPAGAAAATGLVAGINFVGRAFDGFVEWLTISDIRANELAQTISKTMAEAISAGEVLGTRVGRDVEQFSHGVFGGKEALDMFQKSSAGSAERIAILQQRVSDLRRVLAGFDRIDIETGETLSDDDIANAGEYLLTVEKLLEKENALFQKRVDSGEISTGIFDALGQVINGNIVDSEVLAKVLDKNVANMIKRMQELRRLQQSEDGPTVAVPTARQIELQAIIDGANADIGEIDRRAKKESQILDMMIMQVTQKEKFNSLLKIENAERELADGKSGFQLANLVAANRKEAERLLIKAEINRVQAELVRTGVQITLIEDSNVRAARESLFIEQQRLELKEEQADLERDIALFNSRLGQTMEVEREINRIQRERLDIQREMVLRRNESVQKVKDQMEALSAINDLEREREDLTRRIAELQDPKLAAMRQQNRELEAQIELLEYMEELNKSSTQVLTEGILDAAKAFRGSFSDALFDVIKGTKSVGEGLKDVFMSVLDSITRTLTDSIADKATSFILDALGIGDPAVEEAKRKGAAFADAHREAARLSLIAQGMTPAQAEAEVNAGATTAGTAGGVAQQAGQGILSGIFDKSTPGDHRGCVPVCSGTPGSDGLPIPGSDGEQGEAGFFDNLMSGFENLLSDVWDFFGNIFGNIGDVIGDIAGSIGDVLGGIFDSVGGFLGDIGSSFGSIIGDLGSGIGDVLGEVGSGFGDIFSSVSSGFSSVIGSIGSGFSSVLGSIGGLFGGGGGGGGFGSIIGSVIGAFFNDGGIVGANKKIPAVLDQMMTSIANVNGEDTYGFMQNGEIVMQPRQLNGALSLASQQGSMMMAARLAQRQAGYAEEQHATTMQMSEKLDQPGRGEQPTIINAFTEEQLSQMIDRNPDAVVNVMTRSERDNGAVRQMLRRNR